MFMAPLVSVILTVSLYKNTLYMYNYICSSFFLFLSDQTTQIPADSHATSIPTTATSDRLVQIPTPPHPTLIPGTICFLGTWTQWNPSFQMISTTTSRLPWAPSILFPHLIKCSEASSSTSDESVFSFSLSVSKLQRRLSFISAI